MTGKEKELLIKDLSARLPYGVKVQIPQLHSPSKFMVVELDAIVKGKDGIYRATDDYGIAMEFVRPYLRPMSSMTAQEKIEYYATMDKETQRNYPNSFDFSESVYYSKTNETFDWLIANHFDFRNLIGMNIALEAPEGMY